MADAARRETTSRATAENETYARLSLLVTTLVFALAAIWGFLIANFGFGAFIYPLLAMVALAFVFVLTLTRA